jgi:hypothetical protein
MRAAAPSDISHSGSYRRACWVGETPGIVRARSQRHKFEPHAGLIVFGDLGPCWCQDPAPRRSTRELTAHASHAMPCCPCQAHWLCDCTWARWSKTGASPRTMSALRCTWLAASRSIASRARGAEGDVVRNPTAPAAARPCSLLGTTRTCPKQADTLWPARSSVHSSLQQASSWLGGQALMFPSSSCLAAWPARASPALARLDSSARSTTAPRATTGNTVRCNALQLHGVLTPRSARLAADFHELEPPLCPSHFQPIHAASAPVSHPACACGALHCLML